MKPHKYPMILAKMDSQQVSREDIAKELGICPNSWTHKMRGEVAIEVPEAYKVLRYLDIPVSEIYKYFPEEERK